MSACLDDEVLAAWSVGALPAIEVVSAADHAARCPRCASILGDAVSVDPGAAATVGRFELRCVLGSGGMGVVFDAWDPLLERAVAVKMIRAPDGAGVERRRLIEEGRALARLAHPNVVAVHDCGEVGGEVYLAMAHVAGASLARWLDGGPARAERVRVVREIARGLAAIHGAGLVHRDLKPDNVVVGVDGTAVVIDLGLARGGEVAASRGASIAGTPAYWAPEVEAGRPATAASDQHAWWQLVRVAVPELATRRRGAKAMARGLATDPADRYPSMNAAVEALRAALAPRPWRRWAALGGGLAAVGLALAGARGLTARPPVVASCTSPATSWPARGRQVAVRMIGAGAPGAPAVVDEIAARGRAVDGLIAGACRDERAGGAAAERARQIRACAEATWRDSARALDGVVAVDGDLARALEDLAVASPIDRCAGGAVPATPAPPAPERAAEVAGLEAALRAIRVDDARTPAAALAALDELGPAVTAAGHAPLTATWHHDRADRLRGAGRLEECGAELDATAALAAAAGDDELRARALQNRLRLAFMLGQRDTAALEREAAAAVARMHNPAMTAEFDVGVARARIVVGEYAVAVERLTAALAVYDGLALPAPRRTIAVLQDLGAALQLVGDLDRAQAIFDRGYALAVATLGPDARDAIEMRGARATNLMYRERPEAAAELGAVADALVRVDPAPSDARMSVQGYRCELALEHDDRAVAAVACPDAVALGEAVFGPASPLLLWPLILDGRHALDAGDAARAAAQLERATAIAVDAAPNPLLPALAAGHLARAYRALDDPRAAAAMRTARRLLTAQAEQPAAAALLAALAR